MTNPDNVGGLQRYAAVFVDDDPKKEILFIAKSKTGNLVMYDDAIAYGELCRAAPAGGDAEVVRLRQLLAGTQEQFRVVSELLERNQAHHERMMKLMDSAPAGSGEAEAFARKIEQIADERTMITPGTLREIATLLRKLQQGTEPNG